jgi:GDP-fucose protein O-fucosyltransferase
VRRRDVTNVLVNRRKTRRFVAYSPFLRNLAIKVADESLGQHFYAIHGRLGDEAYRWRGKTSAQVFVQTAEFRTWNTERNKVYLASDEPNARFFAPLREHATVVTVNDLKGNEIEAYRNLFPNHAIQMDMLGTLDKLICTQALDFLGSPMSTFSMEIKIMRSTRRYVFPEDYIRFRNITGRSP